jgi:hypothetical protein
VFHCVHFECPCDGEVLTRYIDQGLYLKSNQNISTINLSLSTDASVSCLNDSSTTANNNNQSINNFINANNTISAGLICEALLN